MNTTGIGAQSLAISLAAQSAQGSTDPLLNALTGTTAGTNTASGDIARLASDTVSISPQALALLQAQSAMNAAAVSSLLGGDTSGSLLESAMPSTATPSVSAAAGPALTDAQAAHIGATIKAKFPQLFSQFDSNGDGTLTGSEINTGIATMAQQSEQTLLSMGSGGDASSVMI